MLNREKEIYGEHSLDEIKILVEKKSKELELHCVFFQSNHEGELIEKIHSVDSDFYGIIINFSKFCSHKLICFLVSYLL